MKEAEALKIIKIMATADSWCSSCGESLVEKFGKAFPHFKTLTDKFDIEAFEKRFREVKEINQEKDIWETNVWEVEYKW
jgi:hypothetical protein